MRKITLNSIRFLKCLFLFIFFLGIFSCKKDDAKPDEDTKGIDKSKTYLSDEYESSLRDSVWYYYKALSLWQEFIPPTKSNDLNKIKEKGFIRNTYTKYFEKAEDVLDYLKGLTEAQVSLASSNLAYDWYSIYDRGGVVSSEIQDGVTSGFGMSLIYLRSSSNNNNADLYIQYVKNGSQAKAYGLQRGDQILSINGDTNIDYNYQQSKDFKPLLGYLDLYSITLQVRKSTGAIVDLQLSDRSYSSSPIILSKVITKGSKKVGYLMFNSFASITSGYSYTTFYSDLSRIFSNFQQEGINELILDLRYNEGGDVATAEYIADWIAPSSESGKIMYTYETNSIIETNSSTRILEGFDAEAEFAPIRFGKVGNINLSSVYFLVSSKTASASELLINSLKPVMNTYMIGTLSLNDKNEEVRDRTFGKPVGFFQYRVKGLYVASFRMFNRNGEGNYFEGLLPSTNVWEYSSFKDLGDEEEPMLSTALNHISTGSFADNSLSRASNNQRNISKGAKSMGSFNNRLGHTNSSMFKFKKSKD